MGKYLKEFETQAAYEAAQSGLILPNVSLTVDNNAVHYNPSTPPTPSHDYVEIGGIKWATKNVGANNITDTGLYFAWADVQGYTAAQVGTDKNFSEQDYVYGPISFGDINSGLTKYNRTDGKTVLESSDDAVRANWGGNWRTPTTAEFQSLLNACKFIDASGTEITGSNKITTLSGVTGIYLEDKTDSSKRLFLPAAGGAANGVIYNGTSGYWVNSVVSGNAYNGNQLYIHRDEEVEVLYNWRIYGFTVRGVLDE